MTRATNYHEQPPWAMRSTQERCHIVGAARHEIARSADRLIAKSRTDQRRDDAETVASELIPLCDALKWIARRGRQVLAERRVGLAGRPLWMWGVRSVVERRPWGSVLVLGAWNYPIFLSGVQAAQALAAGNTVLLKPAPGSAAVTAEWVEAFWRAGVPAAALRLLDSSTEAAINAIDAGVDLVVLTGAASTGKAVLQQTAALLTPAIMELSGVDAVIVLPHADEQRLVDAIHFGLMFNSGASCIGPRRAMYLHGDGEPRWVGRLIKKLSGGPPVIVHPAARDAVANTISAAIAAGSLDRIGRFDATELRRCGVMYPVVLSSVPADHAVLQSDSFAPLICIVEAGSLDNIVQQVNDCRYRLGASIFGRRAEADRVAARLNVGSVTINDLVAPTADPRLPFGGRGESGFGVTRGPEGLLAMTTPRVISARSSRLAPHLSPRHETDTELLTGVLQWDHGSGLRERMSGLRRLTSAVRRRGRVKR